MTGATLSVSDARVVFGGVRALQGVSLDLKPGELLGLIGPNGAGKTTLLRLVTGSIRSRPEVVKLDDRPVGLLPVHARVRLGLGMSQQLVRPFTTMSLLDNVTLAAGVSHTAGPWRAFRVCTRAVERRRAEAILERLGLAEAASRLPGEVPLGMLKRLEVARALATEPRVLLLDEPLAGLNHVEAGALADIVVRIARGGTAVVLIEHNLSQVMRISTRLLVLDNGRVLADGEPRVVMTDPAVRAAYLGGAGHL